MIHEILPSDVEFARGMLNSSHSDAEILAYLGSRGIEPAKAAGLVDDLRHGRTPNTQFPFVIGQGSAPKAPSRRAAAQDRPAALPSPRHHVHKHRHKGAGAPWWFLLMLLLFILALGYAFFESGREATARGSQHNRHEIPTTPGK